jgi:hypothetical protein
LANAALSDAAALPVPTLMVSPCATTAGAIRSVIAQTVTVANTIGRRAGRQILEELDIIKNSRIQGVQTHT